MPLLLIPSKSSPPSRALLARALLALCYLLAQVTCQEDELAELQSLHSLRLDILNRPKRNGAFWKNLPAQYLNVTWPYECPVTETQGENAIAFRKKQEAHQWYKSPNLRSMPRNLVRVRPQALRTTYGPLKNSGSTIKLLGKRHYEITNFCIRPLVYGGVFFYGMNVNAKATIKICSEFQCFDWPVTLLKEAPPRNHRWIRQASAWVKCFTGSNPYHHVLHLASMSQFLHQEGTKFSRNSIHLYPAFQADRFRDSIYPHLDNPFQERYFSLWPLTNAILPEGMNIIQVNHLENLMVYEDGAEPPMVCYESGFIDSPQTVPEFVMNGPGKLFAQLKTSAFQKFQSDAIEFTDASGLSSGWCYGDYGSNVSKPVMGFIVRKKIRLLCNVATIIRAAEQLGFKVQLLYMEKMKIEHQIRAMRMIDVLAAVHGAGLMHVIWMRKGSVCIEMYPPGGLIKEYGVDNTAKTFYGAYSLSAGVTHIVWGKNSSYFPEDLPWRYRNLIMDVDVFRNMATTAMDTLKKSRKCQGDANDDA